MSTSNGARSLREAIRQDLAKRVLAPFSVGPFETWKTGYAIQIWDGVGARLIMHIASSDLTVTTVYSKSPHLPVINLCAPDSLQQLRDLVARVGIPIDRS